jgi:ribosomal-protein-alanine N-acetyltransferase
VRLVPRDLVPGPGPTPPGPINAWAREDWVEPFGLYRGERLVAYGELWADDGEAEVRLARLIVAPGERGQGVGRLTG